MREYDKRLLEIEKKNRERHTMSENEKYSLAEMKAWLLGTNANEKAWRLDANNDKQILGMIEAFASTPGGQVGDWVWRDILVERRQAQAEVNAEAEAEATQAKLKNILRRQWKADGGKLADFEAQWKEQNLEILKSGRAKEILEGDAASRRRKAARTF